MPLAANVPPLPAHFTRQTLCREGSHASLVAHFGNFELLLANIEPLNANFEPLDTKSEGSHTISEELDAKSEGVRTHSTPDGGRGGGRAAPALPAIAVSARPP